MGRSVRIKGPGESIDLERGEILSSDGGKKKRTHSDDCVHVAEMGEGGT